MAFGLRLTHRLHRGSVLPRMRKASRTDDGFCIVAGGDRLKNAAVFWSLVAFLLMCAALITVAHDLVQGAAYLVIVGVGTASVLGEMARRHFRQLNLRRATLVVRPWPLRLGGTATARFDKRLRQRAKIDSLSATLVCVEETIRSGGRDQTISRQRTVEIPLDTSNARIGEWRIVDDWKLEIPRHALPSFSVKSNSVKWLIETTTCTSGVDIGAEFELHVVPEVVE
jgi:hypothetical protein